MNKTELVAAVVRESGLTRKDVKKAVNAFTDTVSEALKELVNKK